MLNCEIILLFPGHYPTYHLHSYQCIYQLTAVYGIQSEGGRSILGSYRSNHGISSSRSQKSRVLKRQRPCLAIYPGQVAVTVEFAGIYRWQKPLNW